ncbi:unnamed protein product [Bursaphelenchus xylophilus]|uniref:(pine wood nematode) hypothetical protein n=1 Tax=Bursaphelenchus xylophilus TaxID=6326 RepID=A0A1I7RH89_BURXY|nr:unnamed protein product [Bursaphelenchus xylophilus]CAG9115928.1 unnamed protein product [Bursaphelenchus xylophilus]
MGVAKEANTRTASLPFPKPPNLVDHPQLLMAKSMSASKNSASSSTKSANPIKKLNKKKMEREQTLDKLRVMVGGNENSTQLDIMQGVIDYIRYLQSQLADDVENIGPPADDLVHQLMMINCSDH